MSFIDTLKSWFGGKKKLPHRASDAPAPYYQTDKKKMESEKWDGPAVRGPRPWPRQDIPTAPPPPPRTSSSFRRSDDDDSALHRQQMNNSSLNTMLYTSAIDDTPARQTPSPAPCVPTRTYTPSPPPCDPPASDGYTGGYSSSSDTGGSTDSSPTSSDP